VHVSLVQRLSFYGGGCLLQGSKLHGYVQALWVSHEAQTHFSTLL
jgi:hypothetical protein